jgi:hypothetical protein
MGMKAKKGNDMLYDNDRDFGGNIQELVTQGSISSTNRYKVRITETLEKEVYVDAVSRDEAKEIVRKDYRNEVYVLGAEDLTDLSFSVLYG